MKDSQRYIGTPARMLKYIKANNERFSTGFAYPVAEY